MIESSHKKIRETHKVKCTCNQCGNIIYKYPSVLKNSKTGLVFCNKKCRALYDRKPKIICKCANCGKKVKRLASRLKHSKNGLTFCNKHCSQQYKWKNPDYALMMSDNTKKCWEDPSYRSIITESARKTMKRRREDPEDAKRMDEQLRKVNERQWKDPNFRDMMKEVSRRNWDNPDFYQMQVDKMKKMWEDDNFYQTQVEKMNRLWKDDNFSNNVRKIASEMMLKRWDGGEYRIRKSNQMREMVLNLWSDNNYKKYMSESLSKRWENYEYRLQMCESLVGGFIPQNVIYKDYILENEIRNSIENRNWIDNCRKSTNYTDFFTNEKGYTHVHHIIEFQTIINIYDIHTMDDAKNCNLLWDINNGIPMLEKYHKPLFNILIKEKYGDYIKKDDFTEEMKEYVRSIIYPKIIETYKL